MKSGNTAETFFKSLCENISKFVHAKKDFAINWQEKLFLILPRDVSVVVWCMFWINLTNFSNDFLFTYYSSFELVYKVSIVFLVQRIRNFFELIFLVDPKPKHDKLCIESMESEND